MLLDQKRTRRIVQVAAVFTSIAFAGVIFVVLGLVLFGGGGSSPQDELLDEAQERVEAEPRSPEAWDRLASAHAAGGDFDEATDAARRAVELAPNDFSRTQTLVSLHLQAENPGAAIDALESFTERNPRNSQAFLLLGQLSEQQGRTMLARLSYQRFLQLAPDDTQAPDVRDRLEGLDQGGATP